MPTKRKPVEKYKLTKEMKAFMGNYKQLKKVNKMLRGKLEVQLGDAAETRRMLQEVEGGINLLLQQAPEQTTKDIEGQEVDPAGFNPELQY